ncbi:hypothetical protein G6F31_021937 [Rhizopus arrhizus]|nr:hypothetical protein G6F31_021937 [Rhizopus arrhizus]
MERAVGVGAGVHRTVIGIAQGEGIGERELEWDFALFEVTHRDIGFFGRPSRHAAMVPELGRASWRYRV